MRFFRQSNPCPEALTHVHIARNIINESQEVHSSPTQLSNELFGCHLHCQPISVLLYFPTDSILFHEKPVYMTRSVKKKKREEE